MHAAEQVWQEYHERLRSFIAGKIFDNTATDDILQEVFLKMYSGLPALKDGTKLQSWLYQITRNAIIDYFRSQKPTIDIPEWLPQPEADPGERVALQLSECLQPMIQMLPEKYRQAIVLSELQGLPQKEVARIQGLSLAGAKSRVQRGRVLLKNMLDDCCRFEFDRRGRLHDYQRRDAVCEKC